MAEAVKAVKEGSSIRKAAKGFSVPTMTLHDRVTKKYETAGAGRNTELTPEEEESLKWYVLYIHAIN